jgi:DUF2934 family protein
MNVESRKEKPMGKQNRTHNIRPADGPKEDKENVQEEIRTLAYQLFCECGCEQGHDLEHWLEAERKVLEQLKEERR